MMSFSKSFKLDAALASLRLRLSVRRSTAQASVRAVAGTKVEDATLAAVVDGVSSGFGSGEGP
jgi:hypothetical protein